jgi:multidrug efflux pump subunit AcrB
MKQKLLVTLFVIMVFMAGLFVLVHTNRETIPQVTMDMVTVTTIYPGASPSDAEELISIPIEKKLRLVSNLDKVRSYNVENVSVIVIYIEDRAGDKRKVVQDIKDAVEQVDNLPSKAQKPLVKEVTTENTELISVAFTGKTADVPYTRLREMAYKSEDFFYDIEGVAQVEKYGYYDREYLVEVDPDALDKYRIGMNSLIGVLQMRNIDFPGGALRAGKKEFILRTKGQFKNAEEIRNTVIMASDGGYTTRVKDVARVIDTYEEADNYRRYNGKSAVVFKLYKKRSADEIDLAGRIKKAVSTYSVAGYDDVQLSTFSDSSTMTERRIDSVLEEAMVGFAILGIFMLILLGRRMSVIVLAGIPVTFMVTFIAMKYMDVTFNIISLFGMIMVLGMMVDFSIVVAENSHRFMEHGFKRALAVEKGVSEVFWVVTTTLLCIIVAFLPLLLLTGIMGKFLRPIPVVIITALIASWFVAFFILPTYLNIFLPEHHLHEPKTIPQRIAVWLSARLPFLTKKSKPVVKRKAKKEEVEDENFEKGGFGKVQKVYKSFVHVALKYRYITVGILLVLFFGSLMLVPIIGFEFMSKGGEESIRVSMKLPHETNLSTNLEEAAKIEKVFLELPKDELKSLYTWVGEEYNMVLDPKPGKATYKTTFEVSLTPEKERTRIGTVIVKDLRQKIAALQKKGTITPDMEIKVEAVFMGPPVGKPVNVEIRGRDYDQINKIAKEYFDYLKTVKGVRDLSIDLEDGKTEFRYGVNEVIATRSGVSAYDIGAALNASFAGSVATTVNQDQEEVGIRVRFDEAARNRMQGIHDVKIANRTGGLVSLDSVSTLNTDKAYSQINRLNFKRLVQVQADVDTSQITSVQVTQLMAKKFADIDKRYPGYVISYGGEQEDSNKSMGELGNYFLAALLIIFVILTVSMRSLILPLVVMIAIPFALVGVIFALFIHHQPLSFMSVLGLFSLAGIIVSNTLVLVQFINKFRDEGLDIKDAIAEGGVVRLRPIILTAGSMILELMPVVYGVGGKDYLVAPLALAFGYGLIFATIITLIIIPCFYHIAEDAKTLTARILGLVGVKMDGSIYNSAEDSGK